MKVLLIDDDALFRELARKTLKKQGHETDIAIDGIDVVKNVQNGNFDLVITDLFMPNKEGFEVIQEIRTVNKKIKIIAISSDGPAGYSSFLRMALAFGANGTLQKPFSPEQLVEKIKELGD